MTYRGHPRNNALGMVVTFAVALAIMGIVYLVKLFL